MNTSETLHLDIPLHVRLDTPQGALTPHHVRVVEGMSMLTEAVVEVSLGGEDDPTSLLDHDVSLTWSRGGLAARAHALRVSEVRYLGAPHGHPRFRLLLRASLWFLRFTKDVRKFRDQSAQQIVTTILGEAGIEHRWEIARPPSSRPYTVQYRESKLDFVLRLLEHEGIHYVFEDDGTLVLRDRSSASPPVPESIPYTLRETAGAAAHGAEGITAFRKGTRVGSGRATVNDYDWKKPGCDLVSTKAGRRDVALEVYEYQVGYRDKAEGETLAQLRVEAYEATKVFVAGASTVLGFGPGRAFEMIHDDGISHSGKYVLRRVEHTYTWHRLGLDAEVVGELPEGASRYDNRFEAIPAHVPFRPPLVTPRPIIGGTHTAMVRGPAGEHPYRLLGSGQGAVPLGSRGDRHRQGLSLGPRAAGDQLLDAARPCGVGNDDWLHRRRPRPPHRDRAQHQRRDDPELCAAPAPERDDREDGDIPWKGWV
jgi:type VI secretion system secreted protein VgrG